MSLDFLIELIFDPAHLESGSPGLNLWWAVLAHQPANKRSYKCLFFIILGFAFWLFSF